MNAERERELIIAVCRGSESAWEEIEGWYYPIAIRYCRCFFADPEKVESCAAEAISKLYLAIRAPAGKRGSFDPEQRIQPWLSATAKNACIDRIRRDQIQPIPLTDYLSSSEALHSSANELPPSANHSSDPSRSAIRLEEAEGVRDCMDELSRSSPENARRIEAAWRKFGLDLTYREISEIYREVMAKAKWQVEAGKRMMEDCLRKKGIY